MCQSPCGISVVSEQFLYYPHREKELVRVILKGHELVVQIEGAGVLIQCVDYYAYRSNFERIFPASMQSVQEQKAAEFLSLARAGDSKPSTGSVLI